MTWLVPSFELSLAFSVNHPHRSIDSPQNTLPSLPSRNPSQGNTRSVSLSIQPLAAVTPFRRYSARSHPPIWLCQDGPTYSRSCYGSYRPHCPSIALHCLLNPSRTS